MFAAFSCAKPCAQYRRRCAPLMLTALGSNSRRMETGRLAPRRGSTRDFPKLNNIFCEGSLGRWEIDLPTVTTTGRLSKPGR
jgi:hypothetical protein